MTGNRSILGLFLSLVIVSQSLVAVAAPCSYLASLPDSHSMGMSADDPHAGHHMDESQAGEGTSCCDGGYCSVSGCLPLSALSSAELTLALLSVEPIVPPRDDSLVTSYPETLYRPPIAR